MRKNSDDAARIVSARRGILKADTVLEHFPASGQCTSNGQFGEKVESIACVKCAARRKTAADGTKDTPMGRGAAAAAPHDVLIWAAPHPRRIFCDPAAQGLRICHCEAPTGPWRPERAARGSALGVQSRRTILDNRQVPANTVTLRGGASRTPPPTRCVRSAIHGAKRQCLPEIATGAKRPRNDNSGAGAVLAIARADRQHCAGRGMPLPYKVCAVGDGTRRFATASGAHNPQGACPPPAN